MKKTFVILMLLCLAGCAEIQVASDVLEIIVSDPDPVCDQHSWGDHWKGNTCVKFSGGGLTEFRWVPLQESHRGRKQ